MLAGQNLTNTYAIMFLYKNQDKFQTNVSFIASSVNYKPTTKHQISAKVFFVVAI